MISNEERKEASEAAYLLESKLLKTIFRQIEEASIRQWTNSESLEKREDAWHTYRILKQVKSRLFSVLVNVAQKEGTKEGVFTKLVNKLKG